MTVLSPLWLLALFPWAALTAWVLVGRRRRQRVPFLPLWDAPEHLRRPKKGFEPPPLSVLLALIATLLALLALACPQLTFAKARTAERTWTVLFDRGASMSAKAPSGQPRFVEAARTLAEALAMRHEMIRLDVHDVPASTGWQGPPADLANALATFPRTAVSTRDELRAAVDASASRGGPVLLLSDQDLGPLPANVIPIRPDTSPQNAGVVALAHRPGQVMVTLAATHATSRTLVLQSGEHTLQQPVEIPANSPRNLFLDFEPATDTIEARLEGPADDFEADDRAWLVRRRSWPTLEPRSPVSEELRRIIDVYRRYRPAAEDSPRVAIGRPADVKADEPAVLLAPATGPETPRGEVRPTPHLITTGVDWSGLSAGLAVSSDHPPDGWTVVLRAGDRPLVAVRDADVRQAWVGFESRSFARTPGYVVFWTAVFNWLGSATGEAFTAGVVGPPLESARRLLPQTLPGHVDRLRWPGVFDTPAGKLALNAGRVTFGPAADAENWGTRLAAIPPATPAGIPLAPWLALAALALLAGAAGTWERRRQLAAPRPPAHLDVETLHVIETTFAADGHTHRHETLRPPPSP
jgi:hypothetical protein